MLSVARNELSFLMEHRRLDASVFVVAVYAYFNVFLFTNQPLYYDALKAKKNPLMEDALTMLRQPRSGQKSSPASNSTQ